MPDPQVALERRERGLVEDLRDESEVLVDEEVLTVGDGDPGRLLTPMLLREETEVGEPRDLVPRRPHAEEAAFLLRALRSHWSADAISGR